MSKSREANNDEAITHTLESAAHEAAMADGLIPADGTDGKSKKSGLRRGKWTTEEEAYANRLIYEFKLGLLPLTDGTTLRTFLSKLLNCDPMRISKKFVGQNCIGKQVFRRRQQDLEKLTPEQIETSRKELAELERRFLEKVAQSNRTKTPGVKAIKDGKADDENGSQSIAPWMVPPEEAQSVGNESTHRSSSHTPAPASSSSYQNKDQQPQTPFNPQNFPPNGAPNTRMLGYGVGPDMLTVDYQHIISANNALMSQLYQSGPYPYYPMPPPGFNYHPLNGAMNPGAIKSEHPMIAFPSPFDQFPHPHPPFNMDPHSLNRLALQNQLLEHPGAGFPWNQGLGTPGAALNTNGTSSSSGELNSNSLGPFKASSADWQMQSLMSAGESMENIVQFLSQYHANSQSFENVQAAAMANQKLKEEGGKDDGSKEVHDKSPPVTKRPSHDDDVGYPIDDHPTPVGASNVHQSGGKTSGKGSSKPDSNSSKSGEVKPNGHSPPNHHPLNGSSSSNSEMNGYFIPRDTMASMASMYQRNANPDPSGRLGPPYLNKAPDPVPTVFGSLTTNNNPPAAPNHPSSSNGSAAANNSSSSATNSNSNSNNNGATGALPRNSSVENFWMLVNYGDLPRPEQDVLSETIWEAQQVSGGTGKINGGDSTANLSGKVGPVGVPSIPTSSLSIKDEPARDNNNRTPSNASATENRKRSEETVSGGENTMHLPKKVKIEKE